MYLKQGRLVEKFFGLFIAAALVFSIGAAASGCGKAAKQKIIGKWSYNDKKDFFYTFTENGEMVRSWTGTPDKKEKYRVVDNETLEVESEDGTKSKAKMSFTDSDNTLNMTNEFGKTSTLRRQ